MRVEIWWKLSKKRVLVYSCVCVCVWKVKAVAVGIFNSWSLELEGRVEKGVWEVEVEQKFQKDQTIIAIHLSLHYLSLACAGIIDLMFLLSQLPALSISFFLSYSVSLPHSSFLGLRRKRWDWKIIKKSLDEECPYIRTFHTHTHNHIQSDSKETSNFGNA